MSEQKALQFLDKNNLECAICLERLTEPKTLECLHSYCLHCLQSLIKTSGQIKCPKCCKMYDDLNQFDLKDLTTNEMLSYQVKYVENIESEKPMKCSSCDNQPKYYCSECKMYLCGQCIKHHKMIPVLKDHSLYTLDEEGDLSNKCKFHRDRMLEFYCKTCSKSGCKKCEHIIRCYQNEHNVIPFKIALDEFNLKHHSLHTLDEEGDLSNKCKFHRDMLEFYCKTCSKSGCKKCEHVLSCYQNEHNVIPFKIAVDEFNQHVTKVMKSAEEIKEKLEVTRDTITKERSDFESRIQICRTEIDLQEENLIKKIQEKSREMTTNLDKIDKQNKEVVDDRVKNIDSKLTKVNEMLPLINTMMNKPEERATVICHEVNINAFREEVVESKYDESINIIAPSFIPSKNLDKVLDLEGIGKMTNHERVFEVAEDKLPITVTMGQSVEVKVVSVKSVTSHLFTTLINESGKQAATEVERVGNGEYKIKGSCHLKGDWKMIITAKGDQIKGSPVNIKAEAVGLVNTIDDIQHLKIHDKNKKVNDVILDKEGNLIVSSLSKDVLKFNQEYSCIGRIEIPENVQVSCMHQMSDGHIVYIDALNKTVVMCDDQFKQIHTFCKGTLKNPSGLTVNNETRTMYVADSECHCVFKFNVDNGELLGQIGSYGSNVGYMNGSKSVTLTKEGNLIVTDCGNSRLQMFDANDRFMRIICNVSYPYCVAIDCEENILVLGDYGMLGYSNITLFNKDGGFIKEDKDSYKSSINPSGIAIISNQPRRVAVANSSSNDVRIYNY
ncbi:uncharacterized protein [Antedon mediterranea]|uniref:uncharacterized protein n=1 Tax=Antedon mediterranea TaxID=105859 RepID=UPI003AF8CA69